MTAIEALDKLMLKFPWQQDKELQEAYAVIKAALDELERSKIVITQGPNFGVW
jgi:hypothetical protein